jgi:hypothetical protein
MVDLIEPTGEPMTDQFAGMEAGLALVSLVSPVAYGMTDYDMESAIQSIPDELRTLVLAVSVAILGNLLRTGRVTSDDFRGLSL